MKRLTGREHHGRGYAGQRAKRLTRTRPARFTSWGNGLRLGLLVLALVASTLPLWSGRADTVVLFLRNGDRISGTILAEDAKQVTLNCDFGKLTVPIAAIDRRERVTIAPPSTTPPTTKPPPPASPPPALAPEAEPAAVAKPAVPPRPSFRERYLKNVHGNVQLGADLGFGTKERQLYTTRLQLTYARNRFQNVFDYGVAYGKTDNVLSANRMDGEAKTTFDLGKERRFYAFNHVGAGYDEIRLIDLGYQEGAGLGYKLFTRSNLIAHVEVGGQYHNYIYSNHTSKDSVSVTFGQGFTWNITPKLILRQKAQFSPDVDDFEDYRLRTDANLSYPLWKSLTLNLNVVDLYDSRPPPGVEPNDLTIQAALGYSF